MPGIGSSGFGAGPYGYGTPPGGPAQAGQIYLSADQSQINTGRRIDPATRQYVVDSVGRFDGQGTVPQLVYLAYATLRGSSVIADLGQRFQSVENIDDSFARTINAIATEPVQYLIDSKRLEIVNIQVTRPGSPDAAIITVLWRDLTTGREGQSTL